MSVPPSRVSPGRGFTGSAGRVSLAAPAHRILSLLRVGPTPDGGSLRLPDSGVDTRVPALAARDSDLRLLGVPDPPFAVRVPLRTSPCARPPPHDPLCAPSSAHLHRASELARTASMPPRGGWWWIGRQPRVLAFSYPSPADAARTPAP